MTAVEAPKVETEVQEAQQRPEAEFSLNWGMIGSMGESVQVTMRTARLADWPGVFTARKAFLELATKGGWNVPGRLPAGTAPAPAAVTPATPATPVQTDNGLLVLNSVRMEVTPKPEGKVELKFFGAGHKFPDLYANGSAENMVKLLKQTGDWTENMHTAAGYDKPMRVLYTLSKKLNTKGQPYKDVAVIEPA